MNGPVRLRANAKLTLSLQVLGTRPDGFHELNALTVSVSAPSDRLEVRSAGIGNRCDVVVTGATASVPEDESNLAVRAARELFDRVGVHLDVHIAIHKEIPSGGGLGGGSADAAATLVALQDLLPPPARPSTDDLLAVAAVLGSDVPFCVAGGAAWMRGRGDQLAPVQLAEPVDVLVVVAPFAIATPHVYRAWDRLGGATSRRTLAPPPAATHLLEALSNDLEPAAESVEPRLAEVRADVERVAGRRFLLAGSGSSLWTWFADPEAAAAARRTIRDELGLAAHAGTTVTNGVAPP